MARATDANLQLQLQTSLPFLLWETDAYIANNMSFPLHQLVALLLHGMSLDASLSSGRPFAQLMAPTQCHVALTKLVSCGLSLDQPYEDPDLFISAIQAASAIAGECAELTLSADGAIESLSFATFNASVQRDRRVRRASNINYLASMELSQLKRSNGSGLYWLGPLGDLILGTGDFIYPPQRIQGSRFHTYLSDLLDFAEVPEKWRGRDAIVARAVSIWYNTAMWPPELRRTVWEAVDVQLDLQARASFKSESTRAACISERFPILLSRLPAMNELVLHLPPQEAFDLISHLASKASKISQLTTLDAYLEVDSLIAEWLPAIRAEETLNNLQATPRDKVAWLIKKIGAMESAPKLLPASQSGIYNSPALMTKTQSAAMVDIVRSQAFLSLISEVQPYLANVSLGHSGGASQDALFRVLRRCFRNDNEISPITAVAQWLMSDIDALPYHEFFTQMVWVRDNMKVYVGRGVASDANWNPLPLSDGFLITDAVLAKMMKGEYDKINYYNEVYLALKSFVNSEPEVAMSSNSLWTDTDAMRRMLPVCNKLFELFGYGGPDKPNSFSSVVTNAISFIDNAPSGLRDMHVQKVAAGLPLLLEAVGKTWRETMSGMPMMPFPATFVNPVLHSRHLQTMATDQTAAAQAQLMNKSYPGFLAAIAKTAPTATAVMPPTGLVTTASGKRPAAQALGGPQKIGTSSVTFAPSTSSTTATKSPPPTKSPAQRGSDALGELAAHVSETNSTVTIKAPRTIGTGSVYVKSELAKLEGCKVFDRCWPVGVSIKPWPENLKFCPCKGQKGHEPNGKMHQFKPGFSQKVQKPPFRKP